MPWVATCTGIGAALAALLFVPRVEMHPDFGPSAEASFCLSLMLAGTGFVVGLTLESLRDDLDSPPSP